MIEREQMRRTVVGRLVSRRGQSGSSGRIEAKLWSPPFVPL